MPNNIYQSEFTGAVIDARLAAIPGIQATMSTFLASLEDVYTKDEINAIVASLTLALKRPGALTAETLPTASADTLGKIYYIGPDDGIYTLYVTYEDGENYGWLTLGTTEMDLEDYVTQTEFDALAGEVVGHSEFVQVTYDRDAIIHFYIDASGKYHSNSNYETTFLPITPGKTYKVTGQTIIAILDTPPSGTVNDEPADFASGYDSRIGVAAGESYVFTAPVDGHYLSVLLKSQSGGDLYPGFFESSFVEGLTALPAKVAALEESAGAADDFLVGTEENDGELFISGYYNLNNRSVGSTLPNLSSSTDLRVGRIPVSKGVTVVSNTQLTVTATVGHVLVTKEDVIVAFPTTAEINAGYTVTDEQLAAGAYQLIVVYRISTQTSSFSCKSFYNFEFVKYGLKTRPLDGKTVILCGDSQLGQAGTFETWIMDAVGGKVLNCGFGGARMSCSNVQRSGAMDPYSMVSVADVLISRDFTAMDESSHAHDTHFQASIANLKALPSLGNGKDVILTIAYGGNDFSNNVQIGSATEENVTTYLGALAYAVRVLLTAFPRMVILVVGIPYRVYSYTTDPDTGEKIIVQDSDARTNTRGLHRYDYNDAAVAGAKALNLPGFDMYHRSGRNKFNVFTLCPDGTHPTVTAGRRAQGELYAKILTTF